MPFGDERAPSTYGVGNFPGKKEHPMARNPAFGMARRAMRIAQREKRRAQQRERKARRKNQARRNEGDKPQEGESKDQ